MRTNIECQVQRTRRRVDLHSPSFVLRLDTSRGLRAAAWENRLTGKTLALGGGLEFGCSLDAATRRIPIVGWRVMDEQDGFRKRCQRPEFDDSKWICGLNPSIVWTGGAPNVAWARTHVFVPSDCAGRPLTLTLGGIGLWDFRFMRVFLNGKILGARRVNDRWHKPGQFDVTRLVRFAQDNVIALELRDQIRRTARLDQLDSQHAHALSWVNFWPPQFEQFITVGRSQDTVAWNVERVRVKREGKVGEAVFDLKKDGGNALAARVAYRWSLREPTLHKFIEITNRSEREARLMDLDLGHYATDAHVSEGEQGFPVYADGNFFFSVAHPSGWAMGERGRVALRQYPGKPLAPGETFRSMEVVLGVAQKGKAREAFVAHVRSRMRRARRGHDKPYAIFEAYGSWRIPKGDFLGEAESEKILLDNIRQLAAARRRTGLHFDLFSSEFWVDNDGDLQRPDPKHFPRGFTPVVRELKKLGAALGLWIDSSMGDWTIGDNPVVGPCYSHSPGYLGHPPAPFRGKGFLCRATDPLRTMYKTAFLRHLRENGARLLKFDNLQAICYNPDHQHLPGIYSTEAIQSSVIDFLSAMDRACPEALLMLYWGHRSPWWLLHADVLFEPGLRIEAASPAPRPTLHARDGVTQGLDMAQWHCGDLPPLGKDSLGVWFSDWPWNSQIGKERWQEGFVMDMCRGSLLAQMWNGERRLNAAEQKQMALFIALLKAQPKCFANSRFIFGNPWKDEPYGYCCSDGRRAFLALHNCTWRDQVLDAAASISGWISHSDAHPRRYDVYRWHPDPARLVGGVAKIALRPFDVVLLEVVPGGGRPSLDYPFRAAPMPVSFREPSRTLALTVGIARNAKLPRLPAEDQRREKDAPPLPPKRALQLQTRTPLSARGGRLVMTVEQRKGGGAFQTHSPGGELAISATVDGRTIQGEAVLGVQTYPSAWQAWRFRLPSSNLAMEVRGVVTALIPKGARTKCSAYFIPNGE